MRGHTSVREPTNRRSFRYGTTIAEPDLLLERTYRRYPSSTVDPPAFVMPPPSLVALSGNSHQPPLPSSLISIHYCTLFRLYCSTLVVQSEAGRRTKRGQSLLRGNYFGEVPAGWVLPLLVLLDCISVRVWMNPEEATVCCFALVLLWVSC